MKARRYDLKLVNTATGGLLLLKSMTSRVASSECDLQVAKWTVTVMCLWGQSVPNAIAVSLTGIPTQCFAG